jgi:hypothetical protein
MPDPCPCPHCGTHATLIQQAVSIRPIYSWTHVCLGNAGIMMTCYLTPEDAATGWQAWCAMQQEGVQHA